MNDADPIIAALRTGHDALAGRVATLADEDLALTSGASEWDVAQVLSHLGSGAEINLNTLQAALGARPLLAREEIEAIWARWNAMSRADQAAGFLRANAELTARYESLDDETRRDLRIDVGFLPAPIDVATAAHLRLSELTLHAWDVNVAFDPATILPADATAALLPRSGMLIGWLVKSEPLAGRTVVVAVRTTAPESESILRLGPTPALEAGTSDSADATLTLPAEAWLRLTAGRLSAEHTPAGVETGGAVDLDLLRQVFPGY